MLSVLSLSLEFRSLLWRWFVTRYGFQQGIVINKVQKQPYSHYLPMTHVQVCLWFKQSGPSSSCTHAQVTGILTSRASHTWKTISAQTAPSKLPPSALRFNPICQQPCTHSLQLRGAPDNSTLIHRAHLFICTDKVICRPMKLPGAIQLFKKKQTTVCKKSRTRALMHRCTLSLAGVIF